MSKLSIIIPLYNEEKTIVKLLQRVIEVELPKDIQKEIIVIDDGSTDNSKLIVQNLKLKRVIRIFHERNLGKGAAVRTGIKNSTGDLIIIQDADLEYNPADYKKLLEPILRGRTKIVYGTRLSNYPLKFWGKDKTVLPVHLIANRFLTGLVNFLFNSNLTDMETCYKLFSREVLNKVDLQSTGFEIEPEITIKALKLGYNIIEVPILTTPRGYEEGKKISFNDGIKAIWTIFRYRFSN